ncbi:MAG: YciI family protein [Acidimicrobiia bacterium]
MKYMLLIYGNEDRWASFGVEEFAEIVRQTDALNQALFESGELVGAYGVADQADAKVLRVAGDVPAVTDGPYVETKEYLGSFTIVDCDSEERALEIAAMNPASRYVGVEVRALLHEANVSM